MQIGATCGSMMSQLDLIKYSASYNNQSVMFSKWNKIFLSWLGKLMVTVHLYLSHRVDQ